MSDASSSKPAPRRRRRKRPPATPKPSLREVLAQPREAPNARALEVAARAKDLASYLLFTVGRLEREHMRAAEVRDLERRVESASKAFRRREREGDAIVRLVEVLDMAAAAKELFETSPHQKFEDLFAPLFPAFAARFEPNLFEKTVEDWRIPARKWEALRVLAVALGIKPASASADSIGHELRRWRRSDRWAEPSKRKTRKPKPI